MVCDNLPRERKKQPKSREAAYILVTQGSKLMPTNLQNISDFVNLQVRKISTTKRLQVKMFHFSQTKGENLLVVSPIC